MSVSSRASNPRSTTPRRRRASIENVARITQLTEVQAELSVSQLTRLQKIFASYCSRGNTDSNNTLLSEDAFATLCRDCKLVGTAAREDAARGSLLTSAAANLLYIQKVKEAGDRGMCFDVFLESLVAMAQLRSNPSSREELVHAMGELVTAKVFAFGSKHVRRMSVALAGGDVSSPRAQNPSSGFGARDSGGASDADAAVDDGGLGEMIERYAELSFSILDRSRELLSKPFAFYADVGAGGARHFRFEQFLWTSI